MQVNKEEEEDEVKTKEGYFAALSLLALSFVSSLWQVSIWQS